MVLIVGTLFSGCQLVTVNPEKDRAQIMMSVDGVDITKAEYNNALANVAMYYLSSGSPMPTGKELETLKEEVFNSVVKTEVFAAQGKKDGIEIDEEAKKAEGEAAYTELKASLEGRYENILKNNYTTDELFSAYMQENMVTMAYATAVQEAQKAELKENPDSYLGLKVGTVNGEEVTQGEYSYYFITEELTAYSTTGAGLDIKNKKTKKAVEEQIFNDIAQNRNKIQYCDDNSLEMTTEAIEEKKLGLDDSIAMFFPDDASLESYLEGHNMTVEKFREYQMMEAQAMVAEKMMNDKMAEDIEITEAEGEKYFKENIDQYNKSTVSAMHILTEDETVAKEIYNKAKDITTKEAFNELMESHKGNSAIVEATDLGSFDKATMVSEFSDKAFSMDVNTVSEPVKTQFGYHIIFVYDKAEGSSEFSDYKDAVMDKLRTEKSNEAFSKWEAKSAKELKIEVGDIKDAVEIYFDELKGSLNVKIYPEVM